MTHSPDALRSIESRRDLVEECVELFELACQRTGSAEIEDFLPAPSDPDHGTVALELMRVELEQSWRQGTPRPLDEYRVRFANVLDVPGRLEELAFEEYRCRCQAGESVLPAEYGRRYAVDTVNWPSDTNRPLTPAEVETGVRGLQVASQRLVDAIQPFPEVGDEFAGFRLLEKVGQGTFGAVFRARQADLASRDVVLKITAGASREPQAMARLQHTNIVPVYSIHQRDTLRALCMPLFGRTTLADVVRRLAELPHPPASGRFLADVVQTSTSTPSADSPKVDSESGEASEWQELSRLSYVDACLRLGASLADALAHAHQRGILHRDIKPANVLLTEDGRPMLLDFNISEELEGCASSIVGGTLPYMSPEQRRAMVTGDRIDPRSDVYSFAVLLYQLLTGRRPAAAGGPSDDPEGKWQIPAPHWAWEPLPAVRAVQAQEIRARNPQVPRSVAALVARCLQIDPERRPASIADVRDDLQRHLSHLPLRQVPDRSLPERLAKWAHRHPAWLSGTTISFLAASLLVIVTTLLLLRGRQLRESEALRQLDHLGQQLPSLRMVCNSQAVDPVVRSDATARLRGLLEPYGVLQSVDWRANDLVRFLPEDQQPQLRQQLAELLYWMAATETQTSDEAPSVSADLSQAIHWNRVAQEFFPPEAVPAALQWQASDLLRQQDPSATDTVSMSAHRPPWNAPFEQYLLAQEYLRKSQFDQAAELLEELREREPLDYSTWFLLGNAYAGQTRLSEADGCFTTCLTLWPQADLAHFNRGLCRMQMGRFAEAEADFGRVLQLRGDLAAARVNRALCRKEQANPEGALTDLTRAIQLGGPDPRWYLMRARIYDSIEETQRAKSDRQQGLSYPPRDPAGWLARGLARVDTEPEGALADFCEAERLAPSSRETLRNQAFVLAEHLQRPDEAISILTRLIDRDPRAEDLVSRGVLRARQGNRDAAIADGQQALQQRSTDQLLFQLACVYALNCEQYPQDVRPALANLAKAIGQNPRWISVAMKDPDLRTLRDLAGFRTLLGAATVVQKMAVVPDSQPVGAAADVSPESGDPHVK